MQQQKISPKNKETKKDKRGLFETDGVTHRQPIINDFPDFDQFIFTQVEIINKALYVYVYKFD